MMNNTLIMDTGMKCLIETLGDVGAERFISLVIKEPFDYTKWQRGLFKDMSVEQIGKMAADYCAKNPN